MKKDNEEAAFMFELLSYKRRLLLAIQLEYL